MEYPDLDLMSADMALDRLITGNRRFVIAGLRHPNQTHERRVELLDAQTPFAAILGCADSRVPPEIIFDQGLGDLFVVRVAGNVVDRLVLGSIEYAAGHLRTPLLMVLGHSNCGAVRAALSGDTLEGPLPALRVALQPALRDIEDTPGEVVDHAARVNARIVAAQLKCSGPVLSRLIQDHGLKVTAAFYDMNTGKVEIIL